MDPSCRSRSPARRLLPRATPLLLACLVPLLPACSPPPPPPPPPDPDLGYVEWIAGRPWDLGDLTAAAASYDQLCRRAADGDGNAAELAAEAGPALWLVRTILLPVFLVLPASDDVPSPEALATRCAPTPDPDLAAALADLVAGDDLDHAVERFLAVESQGADRNAAADARLARAAMAVTRLFPLAELGPNDALRDAVAVLDPDGDLLVDAEGTGGVCETSPAGPDCLWERLAAQALLDTSGSDVIDRAQLVPEALDTLARRGLLDLLARVVLPVAEDTRSNLAHLAGELVLRFGNALGVERPEGSADDSGGEEDWPESAP